MNTQKWYVVFNPYVRGKKPTMRHETKQGAIDEAKRISAIEGKKIHVLELVGTARPPTGEATFSERK